MTSASKSSHPFGCADGATELGRLRTPTRPRASADAPTSSATAGIIDWTRSAVARAVSSPPSASRSPSATAVRCSSPVSAKRTITLTSPGRSSAIGSLSTRRPWEIKRSRHLGRERAMPSSMISSASRGPIGAIWPSRSSAPSSADSIRLTTASCWWLCGIANNRPAAKIHVLRQCGLAVARRRRLMTSLSGPDVRCMAAMSS
jgi:hypothetical protein